MGVKGTIYLLHLDGPYLHAAHYLGWCKGTDPSARVATHLRGQGSPLVKAAVATGAGVKLVRTWPDATRDEERALKRRHNARGLCPECLATYNAKAKARMKALRARRAASRGGGASLVAQDSSGAA